MRPHSPADRPVLGASAVRQKLRDSNKEWRKEGGRFTPRAETGQYEGGGIKRTRSNLQPKCNILQAPAVLDGKISVTRWRRSSWAARWSVWSRWYHRGAAVGSDVGTGVLYHSKRFRWELSLQAVKTSESANSGAKYQL